MVKVNERVQIKGSVKGGSKPLLNITVFNAIQGWNHDGYLTPKEAIGMADYLRNWGEENLRAEDV
jgi:hypothetical protein